MYEGIIERYIKPSSLAKLYVNEIRGIEFQDFFNSLSEDLTKTSIKRIRGLINNAMKQAVMSKLIAFNACESTVIPSGNERYDLDEVECRRFGIFHDG